MKTRITWWTALALLGSTPTACSGSIDAGTGGNGSGGGTSSTTSDASSSAASSSAGASSSSVASSSSGAMPVCGDGVVSGMEECDPPDGVTCSESCTHLPELCGDGFDNDGNGSVDCDDPACAGDPVCPLITLCAGAPVFQFSTSSDTLAGTNDFAGSCAGAGAKERIHAYIPPGDGLASVKLTPAVDLALYARSTCHDAATELACSSVAGEKSFESFGVPVKGGKPLYLFVDGPAPASAGAYTLSVQFFDAADLDAEPNDTPATAIPYTSPTQGVVAPIGDDDFYSIVVPGPSSTLVASMQDFGDGACDNFKLEGELEIYGTDGTTSLAYDDGAVGPGWCPLATATNLAAGTYFVRLAAPLIWNPNINFKYKLVLTVL